MSVERMDTTHPSLEGPPIDGARLDHIINRAIFKIDVAPISTARDEVLQPRRRSGGRWAQAFVGAAAGSSREAAESAARQPGPRDVARAARCSLVAEPPLHTRVPGPSAPRLRARRVSCLPLLDPARPPAPGGGVGGQGSPRARDEVRGDPARANREPCVRAHRPRPLRALSPACAPNPSRSSSRARVRSSERSQALAPAERGRSTCSARYRLVRCVVRWLEAPASHR